MLGNQLLKTPKSPPPEKIEGGILSFTLGYSSTNIQKKCKNKMFRKKKGVSNKFFLDTPILLEVV